MSQTLWNITVKVYRQKEGEAPHFDEFKMEVNPEEYVLDAVERVWAFHDRSLVFRHACHHSTCGACGMRVNGVEKLTCITPINAVTTDGGTLQVEPMRNFPVVSDLAVDMTNFYTRMEQVGHREVLPSAQAGFPAENKEIPPSTGEEIFLRLADCIECGLCISACPIATTTPSYLGPAVLAGAHQHGLNGNRQLLALVDSEDGVWRCHSAFECTAVCPSFVEPAWRIMDLRKQVIRERFRNFFSPSRASRTQPAGD